MYVTVSGTLLVGIGTHQCPSLCMFHVPAAGDKKMKGKRKIEQKM